MAKILLLFAICVSSIPSAGFPQSSQTITNPAEYHSYVQAAAACSSRPFNSSQSAVQWEEFVRSFPDSAQKEDALQGLLVSYYRSGASEKLTATAERLLQVNANSLPALTVLTYEKLVAAESGTGSNTKREEATSLAKRGLKVISDLDENKCEVAVTRCIAPFAAEVFKARNRESAEEALNGMMSFLLQRFCTLRPRP